MNGASSYVDVLIASECMGMGKTGSHRSHAIPVGMGIRSAMVWEWE